MGLLGLSLRGSLPSGRLCAVLNMPSGAQGWRPVGADKRKILPTSRVASVGIRVPREDRLRRTLRETMKVTEEERKKGARETLSGNSTRPGAAQPSGCSPEPTPAWLHIAPGNLDLRQQGERDRDDCDDWHCVGRGQGDGGGSEEGGC